jgi:Lipocalin-like domain
LADDITSPIVGFWKLTATTTKNVATDVMERQYGERPSGYQLFSKGGYHDFHQRR